jgi:AraC-type DNA-binding domain-containing proteins
MIAAECGYDDSNYFSSVFKKLTDQTPSEYRAKFNDKRE